MVFSAFYRAVHTCESVLEARLCSVCNSSWGLLVHRGISSFAAFIIICMQVQSSFNDYASLFAFGGLLLIPVVLSTVIQGYKEVLHYMHSNRWCTTVASDDLEPSSGAFKVSMPCHIWRTEPCNKIFTNSYLTKIWFLAYWPTFSTWSSPLTKICEIWQTGNRHRHTNELLYAYGASCTEA